MRRKLSLALLTWGLIFGTTASAADDRSWLQLLKNTIDRGAPTALLESVSFNLKSGTSFSKEVDREVSYFTVETLETSDGAYVPRSISAVDEKWTKLGDYWRVQQKIRVVNLRGKLTKITQSDYLFDPERIIVGEQKVPQTDANDPKEIEAWEKDIEKWVSKAEELPLRIGDWRKPEWGI